MELCSQSLSSCSPSTGTYMAVIVVWWLDLSVTRLFRSLVRQWIHVLRHSGFDVLLTFST